jgi:hypothetical protein
MNHPDADSGAGAVAADPTNPPFEVGDLFRDYGPAYRAEHPLTREQSTALTALANCRTKELGGHLDECDQCGHQQISYNSCRNRNCPKCRASQRRAWVEERARELLPIQYFHLVFTLPEALLALTRDNRLLIYNLLFRIAAETLQTFAQHRWGGRLGIIMVLHTWGQTLNDHPHVHCIVTGGVLTNDGRRFIRAPKNFLFAVKALSPVFRQKFIEALEAFQRAGALNLSGQPALQEAHGWSALRHALYQHAWVVYAKRPFAEPAILLRYLGRYINRIAIANHRITSIDHGNITFRYHDNRDDQDKCMTLAAAEFIRRFLSHVLPARFHRIRCYGFLVNSQREHCLAQCRAFLGRSHPEPPDMTDRDELRARQGIDPTLCPKCGQGHLHPIAEILPQHHPPPFYLEAA